MLLWNQTLSSVVFIQNGTCVAWRCEILRVGEWKFVCVGGLDGIVPHWESSFEGRARRARILLAPLMNMKRKPENEKIYTDMTMKFLLASKPIFVTRVELAVAKEFRKKAQQMRFLLVLTLPLFKDDCSIYITNTLVHLFSRYQNASRDFWFFFLFLNPSARSSFILLYPAIKKRVQSNERIIRFSFQRETEVC